MSVIQGIILGIIQGLTEFLPVSSSGHLALGQQVLGLDTGGLFLESLLHLGTLAAVLIAFRKTVAGLFAALISLIKKIFTGKFSLKACNPNERMLVMLVISCLPLFIALACKNYIDMLADKLWLIGAALIINSIILFVCDRLPEGKVKSEDIKFKHSLAVGFAQVIATVPGISRSGTTITAGVASGLDRSYAAQYSFILSIPTILAGAAVSFIDAMTEESIVVADLPAYIAGTLVSFAVGFLAIQLLQYLLKTKRFFFFSIYCFIVGGAAIALSIIQ